MDTRPLRQLGLVALLAVAAAEADNPVITHRQLADPNAFVFNDRIYAICSNDDDNHGGYDMQSAVVISTRDLVNWTDHGDVFRTTRDAKWAAGSYAPAAIAAKGKVYMYFPNIGAGVGVLIADRPEGPYKDPLGKALISGSTFCPMVWCFDPTIFVDDDDARSAYLIWGGGDPYGSNFRGIALGDDMISLKGNMTMPETPNSFEGPFVHKYKGTYYLHYPVGGSSDIEYSTSTTSPISGYTRKGVLLPNPTLGGRNINLSSNSHESVFEYKGNWYMMYHARRLPTGTIYKRDVSIDKVEYDSAGAMKQVVVTSGMAQLANFDPYDSIPAATMSAQSGIKASFDASTWTNYLVPQSSGSWIRLSKVDFGTGAKQFLVDAGTTASGARVEVRTDSASGTIAGTCAIATTGSTTATATTSCDVAGLVGVKDVFLKFVGTMADTWFSWYRFVPRQVAIAPKHRLVAAPAPVAYWVFDLQGKLVRTFETAPDIAPTRAWADQSRSLASGAYVVKRKTVGDHTAHTSIRTVVPAWQGAFSATSRP